MKLSIDEQHLMPGFWKLTPAAMDELLTAVPSLAHGDGGESSGEDGIVSSQCEIKQRELLRESEKIPIFTE